MWHSEASDLGLYGLLRMDTLKGETTLAKLFFASLLKRGLL